MQDWFSTINYLMIEANSQCNLKCQSCTREKLAQEGLRTPLLMSEDKLRFLLDQLKDCPIETIKFEGLSEPFLHPQFAKLCGVVKSYFPKVHLIVITNLQYAIGNVHFKEVASYAGAMYLSIDGVEETYEELRTGARWSVLLKNLAFIKDHLDDDTKKKIFINFTASEKNYRELPKMYELNQEYGLGGVRFNLVQNWEEDKMNDHYFSADMLSFIKDYKSDLKGAAPWDYKDCFWPYNGVVIDVEGRVRQCVLNTTQKELGNAFTTPLKTIFNENPLLTNLRTSLEKNAVPESCKNCDYKNLSSTLSSVFSPDIQRPKTKVLL